MKKTVAIALVTIAQLGLTAPASAAINWVVQLTNGQENPPTNPTLQNGNPRPASYGEALLSLNDAQTALTYSITVFNIDFTGTQTTDINDNLTNAHFHAGPAVTAATNGPVVFGFLGAPFNDNNPNDVVSTAFATGVGGTVSGKWDLNEGNNTTLAAQLNNILSGRSYVNFHTTQFGGGEIRGNIGGVPEPATWAMLIGGFGLIGGAMRQARRMETRLAA